MTTEHLWLSGTPQKDCETKAGSLLNWYAANYAKSDAHQWLKEYAISQGLATPAEYPALEHGNIATVGLTFGWLARMASRGANFSANWKGRLATAVSQLIETGKTALRKTSSTPRKPRQTKPHVFPVLQELEGCLDAFFESGYYAGDIKLETIFKQPVNTSERNAIKARFEAQLEEIRLIGNDADISEAYDNLSSVQVKRYIAFLESILSHLNTHATPTSSRKPRKTKTKTPEQLTVKVKYCASFEPLGLTSLKPTSIIGANEVWLFDTRYKKLHYLVAEPDKTMSVAGQTVVHFDSKKSVMKVVRKPQEILPIVMDGGKVQLRHVMAKLKTHAYPSTGRLGQNILICRAS